MNAEPLPILRLAREVQARYPLLAGAELQPLGSAGGFSGANLWRSGSVYLRAWPATEVPDRLRWIHARQEQARQAGLDFVPRLLRTHLGETHLVHAGRCWEAGTWQPGMADYHRHPSPARLTAGGVALARLHVCWANEVTAPMAPMPGIQRRRHALHRALGYLHSGGAFAGNPPQAEVLLRRWLGEVPRWLDALAMRPLPLQPCLVDPWHDHLLFTEDRITGLIDYGAMQLDHPSVDLARMLGSLVGDGDWSPALHGYRSVRPLSDAEVETAHRLDRSGSVLALAHWLQRLPSLAGPERDRAGQRLSVLVQRVAAWHE